jgi:hypothetical protein
MQVEFLENQGTSWLTKALLIREVHRLSQQLGQYQRAAGVADELVGVFGNRGP